MCAHIKAPIFIHVSAYTGLSVRRRYAGALAAGIQHGPFSADEKQKILQHAKDNPVNPRWMLCAMSLQGRTGEHIPCT